MNSVVVKLGNSLALLIPAGYVRATGLKEGDKVQVFLTVDGGLSIRAAKWDRRAFAEEVAAIRDEMPETVPVINELRRGGRY